VKISTGLGATGVGAGSTICGFGTCLGFITVGLWGCTELLDNLSCASELWLRGWNEVFIWGNEVFIWGFWSRPIEWIEL